MYAANSDFVLEFFLPAGCSSHPEGQKKMLTSLSIIIQVCRSMRVVTDKELKEETRRRRRSMPISKRTVMLSDDSSTGEKKPLKAERSILHEKNTLGIEMQQYQADDKSRGNVPVSPETGDGKGSVVAPGEKKRAKSDRVITLELVCQHFAESLKDAAKSLGVCPTTLKRVCRQHGTRHWPSRKIKKVGYSLEKLQVVIDSVQNGSLYSNFEQLASTSESFSASKLSGHEAAAASKSPCSWSCSSSQYCSSGSQQHTPCRAGENSSESALRQARLTSTSQTHTGHQNVESLSKYAAWRVKVSYGEEKIRFRLSKSCWGFSQLVQQVVRRFNIGDINGLHLKYLDDDDEWVLLTCDADLEECIDICRSSQQQTIKLSLRVSSYNNSTTSVGSNGRML